MPRAAPVMRTTRRERRKKRRGRGRERAWGRFCLGADNTKKVKAVTPPAVRHLDHGNNGRLERTRTTSESGRHDADSSVVRSRVGSTTTASGRSYEMRPVDGSTVMTFSPSKWTAPRMSSWTQARQEGDRRRLCAQEGKARGRVLVPRSRRREARPRLQHRLPCPSQRPPRHGGEDERGVHQRGEASATAPLAAQVIRRARNAMSTREEKNGGGCGETKDTSFFRHHVRSLGSHGGRRPEHSVP